MKESIKQKLLEIEEKEHVRILYAVESGSRAWGFASPDSDYDVRFIYVRRLEDYLRLDEVRDVIEWQLDDVLDINGWDLRKMLRLLQKSNPTIFEWNNSPIIYHAMPEWQPISAVVNDYFQSVSGLYHYLSMAKSNYREYLKGETVRLKKYFYVIRPILACKWILEKGTPPPMLFSELCDAQLEESLRPEIEQLLHLKIHSPEVTTGRKIQVLNDYIERNIDEISAAIEGKYTKHSEKQDMTQLNAIFQSIVMNQE